MALTLKNTVFWNVVEICGRFGGTYWVLLKGGTLMHLFLCKLKAGCPARSKQRTECFFYRRTEHGSFMG
jgi:hypothetical protein